MDKRPASSYQIAGSHYQTEIQHWDYVVANELDYFQAQITKYVTRWKKKNGIQDLQKAQHFLEKYIELNMPKVPVEKYPVDYQEQLSIKMKEMQEDARRATGIPEHLREEVARAQEAYTAELRQRVDDACCEPQPNGYVNQDGPVAKDSK